MSAQPDTSVVSLTTRTRFQPNCTSLACAQIRAARERLGFDRKSFAEHLTRMVGWRVREDFVARWERSTTPPGDVLVAAQSVPGEASLAFTGEAVTPYAGRGMITREQWNGIISGCSRHLWLYGMAEFGYATDDEVPAIVSDAATRGCDIRVLLLSPDYEGIGDIDASEGSPPGTLASRIRASLRHFGAMREATPSVQVRVYGSRPTISIVRGDGEMLTTPYVRNFLGSNSPTYGLTAVTAPRMFGRYESHFDGMWRAAVDWTP